MSSDEELLAAHIAGEAGQFEVLVERYSRELFHFLLRFAGNRALAEDCLQEAFLQVHVSAGTFDLSRRFKPWLFTIAANKARDMLRRRARRPEMPLDATIGGSDEGRSFAELIADEGDTPAEIFDQSEQRELVRRIVEQMPDNLREVLILGYFHQFPYKEMAGILGIPLGTVKSRLHAAVTLFGRTYRTQARKKE